MNPPDTFLDDLIHCWCNRQLDECGLAELEARLLANPAARARFRQLANVHAGLYQHTETTDPVAVPPRRPAPVRHRWLAAAAGLALAATITAAFLPSLRRPSPISDQIVAAAPHMEVGQQQPAFAVLTESMDAVWSPTSQQPHTGGTFAPGNLELTSGLVGIEFFCGASVTVEGPARLEFISAKRGILHYGKLRAKVPPQARGFTIATADTEFVDLGTEFGLNCKAGGSSELHVFQGEVEVHDRSGTRPSPQLVTSGDGLKVTSPGTWTDITTDETHFVDASSLNRMASREVDDRFSAWQRDHAAIADRDGLIAYYDFQPEQTTDRSLRDRGPDQLHGAIVGCKWSTGRWPGKHALEFKQTGDRVRLDIPGEFTSLTMTVWLRIDGFDREFNSILLSDAYENGQAHWQIKQEGVIDLGIKPPEKVRELYLSRRALDMSDLGRWVHLAVCYDRPRHTVTHYLDGLPIQTLPVPATHAFPLRLGPAEIGNWSPAGPVRTGPIRNFNGRMDELALFRRALDAAEIQALYQMGKPR